MQSPFSATQQSIRTYGQEFLGLFNTESLLSPPTLDSVIAVVQKNLVEILSPEQIAHVSSHIQTDVDTFRENDPASLDFSDEGLLESRLSVIAVISYRVLHALTKAVGDDQKSKEAIAAVNRHVITLTSTEIGPGALIGDRFSADHFGSVVGETAEIGNGCFLYHNTTIGGTGSDSRVMGRHPKIGNNVFMGSGLSIMGNTVIWGGDPDEFSDQQFDTIIGFGSTIRDAILEKGVRIASNVAISKVRVPAGVRVVGNGDDGKYIVMYPDDPDRKKVHVGLEPAEIQDLEAEYLEWKRR